MRGLSEVVGWLVVSVVAVAVLFLAALLVALPGVARPPDVAVDVGYCGRVLTVVNSGGVTVRVVDVNATLVYCSSEEPVALPVAVSPGASVTLCTVEEKPYIAVKLSWGESAEWRLVRNACVG